MKSTLVKQRCDVDRFHLQVYNEVTVLCQSVGIEESVPRVTNRRQNRQNLPSDSPGEYYKHTTTIPMLDHLISELNVRFTEYSSQFLLQFTQLLPSELIKNLTKTKKTDFDDLTKFYEDDLPLSKDFSVELELWKNYWSSETRKADAEALNTPEKELKRICILTFIRC